MIYSENYIKINNYITLLMSTEEVIQENNNLDIEVCEECNGEINCEKDSIYILTKDEKEKLQNPEAEKIQNQIEKYELERTKIINMFPENFFNDYLSER